jgi:hypothetical protein
MFASPVGEGFGGFRSYSNNLCIPANKLGIVLAQLRHMLAAVGSLETAVENQHYIFLALKSDSFSAEFFSNLSRNYYYLRVSTNVCS